MLWLWAWSAFLVAWLRFEIAWELRLATLVLPRLSGFTSGWKSAFPYVSCQSYNCKSLPYYSAFEFHEVIAAAFWVNVHYFMLQLARIKNWSWEGKRHVQVSTTWVERLISSVCIHDIVHKSFVGKCSFLLNAWVQKLLNSWNSLLHAFRVLFDFFLTNGAPGTQGEVRWLKTFRIVSEFLFDLFLAYSL